MGLGEWIVVILSIILAAWFLIGNYLNNRNSQVILARMVRYSTPLGKILNARFLASTSAGYRAMIKFENGQFSQVEVVMGFLRRENLPLWLFQLITRKPDMLTLNFSHRNQPEFEYWAFQLQQAPSLVEQTNRGRQRPLVFREEMAGFRIYAGANTGSPYLGTMKELLSTYPRIRLLAVEKKVPHLSIAIPVNDVQDPTLEDFLEKVNQLSI